MTQEGVATEKIETAEELGLKAADISLFSKRPGGLQSQRASISPRDIAILFRTEIVSAVIFAHRTLIFPCRCSPE